MPDDEVTMGEVVRRLDTIATQLAQITSTLAADRRHYDATFVNKELLKSQFGVIELRITETEKDIAEGKKTMAAQQDRNRSMTIALISIAIPALISVVGIILSVLGAGDVGVS